MIQILRDSLAVLRQHERRKFKAVVLLNLLISIIDILSLAILVFIVSYYTQPAGIKTSSWLPVWFLENDLILLISVFFVLFSLKNLAAFLVFRFQYNFICQVSNRLSQSKLVSFLNGDYRDYINIDSAAQIRRISYNPTEFCHYVLAGIQQVITELMLVFLAVAVVFIYNPNLFVLLFLVLAPPVAVVFYLIRKRLKKAGRHTKANSERSLQYLHEALEGYVESNIYDKKDFFIRRYTTFQQLFNKHLSEAMIVQGMPHRIIEVFAVLGVFILIATTQDKISDQGSAFVTVAAFMAGAYKIIPGIVKILNLSSQVKTYEFTIKDLKPDEERKKEVSTKQNLESIEFINVGFSFSGRTVLEGFDLELKKGDFLGLSGRSGEGKTTILNLLLGFLEPDSGEIRINQQLTGSGERKNFWPLVAYVKQQTFLLHDTIFRNITLDEKEKDLNKLNRAIEISGLQVLLDKFPEGLNKVITENGKNISGGERQRIAIARALYKDADLIILDEPFNELDEASEYSLIRHFKQMAESGKIVILITHHSKGMELCNKTIELHESVS